MAGAVLAHVMLGVLDEKWKDHLYDLDQLRNSIGIGRGDRRDPLIEYKHEAYTMFEDLMHDIHSTFAERFLRAQIVFNAPRPPAGPGGPPGSGQQGGQAAGGRPRRRYNATGILEDVADEESAPVSGNGEVDVGPSEPPASQPVARPEPTLVAAGGRARPLSATGPAAVADWSSVGRNDPCPCGSGKKYKKCHGTGASRP